METIVVYSADNSNRLKFVLDWLLKERLHLSYTVTTNEADTAGLPFFISYGKPLANSVSIPDEGLLWKTGIQKIEPLLGSWKDIPTLFAAADGEYTVPFDLFTAVFFLLSRYEEYYHYHPDKHGRYPAAKSILCKNGWLMRPIVDEWLTVFRKVVQAASGIQIEQTPFLFQPTYDIDMAYSHLHKGVGRIVGAYLRALITVDLKQINERTQVLKKKQKDPYDSFRWLRQMHKEYDLKPLYFVLSSLKTTAFDKNIHPQHPAMVRVIKNLAKESAVGIHPSYFSERHDALNKEKKTLEQVSGKDIHISRQHYIRMKMPRTYRVLLEHGITEDYSMGYGSHLGFRAGTGNSFAWYDLEKETITPLRVFPFCFMDTTAHYEAKMTVNEAFEQLHVMRRKLHQTGSTMITVFHNFSLGTSSEWKGWKAAYEQFMQEQHS
jgi:hypothetical protein